MDGSNDNTKFRDNAKENLTHSHSILVRYAYVLHNSCELLVLPYVWDLDIAKWNMF